MTALGSYDEAVAIAERVAAALPGTLATLAYLAEIRPLIPPAERAWLLIADREVQALLRAGDLNAARHLLQAIHNQVLARATTDPANTQWQRDLSISYNNIGDAAVAAGDLTTHTSYQASLDITARLAAADPANTEWQHDLSLSHEKIGNIAAAAPVGTGPMPAYQHPPSSRHSRNSPPLTASARSRASFASTADRVMTFAGSRQLPT